MKFHDDNQNNTQYVRMDGNYLFLRLIVQSALSCLLPKNNYKECTRTGLIYHDMQAQIMQLRAMQHIYADAIITLVPSIINWIIIMHGQFQEFNQNENFFCIFPSWHTLEFRLDGTKINWENNT